MSTAPTNGKRNVHPNQLAALEPTKWKPGQSGNPGGRSKGFASAIREATKDGKELIDFFTKVLRDEDEDVRNRAIAASWLSDHGFGKAPQELKIGGAESETPVRFNFSTLTDDELDAYRKLLTKVAGGSSAVPQNGNGHAGGS